MVVICLCGHADQYHSTGTPNKCTKCEECQYYRPRGNKGSTSYSSNKPIKAKFDGICKVCKSKIKAGEHQIIRNSNNVWIHYSCNKTSKINSN